MLKTIGVFLLLLVASLVLLGAVIAFLPADHFVSQRRFLAGQPPLVRTAGIFLKNVVGFLIVLGGIVLSLPGIPGQGLLTILIGLLLLDVPYRRRLILLLLKRPHVQRSINWLRKALGRPPFVLPEDQPRL